MIKYYSILNKQNRLYFRSTFRTNRISVRVLSTLLLRDLGVAIWWVEFQLNYHFSWSSSTEVEVLIYLELSKKGKWLIKSLLHYLLLMLFMSFLKSCSPYYIIDENVTCILVYLCISYLCIRTAHLIQVINISLHFSLLDSKWVCLYGASDCVS